MPLSYQLMGYFSESETWDLSHVLVVLRRNPLCSGDLNTRLVGYSKGFKVVRYSGRDLNTKQKYSCHESVTWLVRSFCFVQLVIVYSLNARTLLRTDCLTPIHYLLGLSNHYTTPPLLKSTFCLVFRWSFEHWTK